MSQAGRRGGPPDLKGTLGTLIRTTLNQVGAVTDVARRRARSGVQRIDGAMLDRRRRDALADLGEALFALASAGEIEIEELPELHRLIGEVEEIDRRIAEADGEVSSDGRSRRPIKLVPRQERRPGPASGPHGGAPGLSADRSHDDRSLGGPGQRVWRPTGDPGDQPPGLDVDVADDPGSDRARRETTRERPATRRRAEAPPGGGGGIVFVEDDAAPAELDPDDSVAAYMNDGDVPPRR